MEVPPDWTYVVAITEAEVDVKTDGTFENKNSKENDQNSGSEMADLKEGKKA